MKNIVIISLLAVIGIIAFVFLPVREELDEVVVVDFESCVEAGYPVLETFPEQCVAPDGTVYTNEIENAEVIVETPGRGEVVTSPLTVSGKARGNWFFEANLPITLKDENGKVLAQVGAMTADEWMTTEFAAFTVVLDFEQPETEFGVLLIEKDNPSGLSEFDASYAVPVRFR